jgi:hypothetical protein
MSSGLRLALLTLNLTQNDFDRMDRDNLKKYIENFLKQEFVRKDYEKYKVAAKLALENKPRIEEKNIHDDIVNVEEENTSVGRYSRDDNYYIRNNTRNNISNNPLFNPLFNPFSMFNSSFSNMMNEIDNLHKNFGNYNMQDNFSNTNMTNMSNTSSTNMINSSNGNNNFTKTYSKTLVNNNGTGYIKEESIENDGKGAPKVKSFYRKIVNGKYVEEPNKTSKKLIEQ